MTSSTENAPKVGEATTAPQRLRLWICLGTALVLVVAGSVIGTVLYRHHARYADAPGLDVEGGEFYPISGGHGGVQQRGAGGIAIVDIQGRRNTEQGFVIWLHNPSSVTQTILGAQSSGETVEHDRVLVSRSDPDRYNDDDIPFSEPPVEVPPGQERAVKFLTRTSICWHPGHSETYTALYLRVGVGGSVRHERIPITSMSTVVIEARRPTC